MSWQTPKGAIYGTRVIWGNGEPTEFKIEGIPKDCLLEAVMRGPSSPAYALLRHPSGALSSHIIKSQSGMLSGPWVLAGEYARSDGSLHVMSLDALVSIAERVKVVYRDPISGQSWEIEEPCPHRSVMRDAFAESQRESERLVEEIAQILENA